MSDVHSEFDRGEHSMFDVQEQPDDKDTVLVLPGDVDSSRFVKHRLKALGERFKAVIFVAGNHEFYGTSIISFLDKMEKFNREGNVHFLNNSSVVIDGVVFLGGTMWTSMGEETLSKEELEELERLGLEWMNDFRHITIKNRQTPFLPYYWRALHRKTKKFIQEELTKHKDKTTVVVTHHAPSFQSIDSFHTKDHLKRYYASDLESFIKEFKPNYWFHGHIHTQKDYKVGDTRILCNARGYFSKDEDKNKVREDFNPLASLEI